MVPISTRQKAKMASAMALSRVSTSEIVEVLEHAAIALAMKGWTQGKRVRRDGSMCLTGAIDYAVNSELVVPWGLAKVRDWDERCLIFGAQEALVAHLSLPSVGALPRWNDAKGRSRPEVLELLRNTAKEIEDL